MLDIKYIRDNADAVRTAVTNKRLAVDIDALLALDERRRALLAETETLQATKNNVSKELPSLSEQEKAVKLLEMKEVDSRQVELKQQLKEVEFLFQEMMLQVPNVPSPETPVGADDSDNVPWSYWSPELGHVDPKDTDKVAQVPKKFDFAIQDHVTLGEALDLVDLERGVVASGSRGYYLKNEGVLLHYGLLWYALEKLRAKGFTLFAPPTMVREFALVGSGHFPGARAEVYQVANAAHMEDPEKQQDFLVGTSEASLLAYYADTILDEAQLPLQLTGISPCYRSEVGSYGKDAKGLYRVHEFMKVEQMIICKADILEGDKWLETLREISESILQDLQLPYRILNICTGDMGAGKYKMYDIETWMPSRNSFGETHSASNLTDWQARRLNLRYRDGDGKIKYAYTLNNTAVASPRLLIAVLENYQQADGGVVVPEVLRKYVGMDVIKPRN
jgi:seryl-tRNA synthetase